MRQSTPFPIVLNFPVSIYPWVCPFFQALAACNQGSRPNLHVKEQVVNIHFFLGLPVGVASLGWPLLDDWVRHTATLSFTGLTGGGWKHLGKTPAEPLKRGAGLDLDIPRKNKRTRLGCLVPDGPLVPAFQVEVEAREGVLAVGVALQSRKH